MTPCQQALRAAHQRHGQQLEYRRKPTRNGLLDQRWRCGDASVRIISTPGELPIINIACAETVATLHTNDPQPVLDLLASLGLAPIALSSGFIAALEIEHSDTRRLPLTRPGERP